MRLKLVYYNLLMIPCSHEDSYNNVISIKAILTCDDIAFGLKINFHKSKLTGINVERNSLKLYAKSLNYTFIRVPFKYLG